MRTGLATVPELLAHGGWLLDDAQLRHSSHPETFLLPPDDKLDGLVPGTMARLVFQLLDQADPAVDGVAAYGRDGHPQLVVAHERMWVWVEHRKGQGPESEFIGILDNLPVSTHTRLRPGARLVFRARDVIDTELEPASPMQHEIDRLTTIGFAISSLDEAILPEDPARPPSLAPSQTRVCERAGVRPERPSPLGSLMLVGKNLTENASVVYGARFPATPDRSDCGWMVWADHSDMGDPAIGGYDAISTLDLQPRHPNAWKYLALPPGWAFVLGQDDYEDVFQDPELLAD